MTNDQLLLHRVGTFRRRIRLLITQQWLCVGLTGALLAGLLLVAATKFLWWTDAIDYLWALLLLGAVVGLAVGWTRRITPMVAAQIADERAGLKERLSTGVEIAGSADRSPIAQAQLADAAQHAQELEIARVLPWRAPRQLRYLVAAAVLLLAVIFVPEWSIFHSRQEQLDREAMRREGARIQRVAKAIEAKLPKKNAKDENAAIARRVAAEMKKLGKDQARGRIPKKQAMLRMNELQKTLKEAEQKASGGQNNQKSMEQVAAQLQQSAEQQSQQGNNENAKALKQMAENVSKQDREGAKRQLEELARKLQSGQMSADEVAKTSEMLQQMAQGMSGSGLDQASQPLKDAAKQLQQAAQTAKDLQKQMASAKTDAERQALQKQMQQAVQQASKPASQQTAKAGEACKNPSQDQQSADSMNEMSQTLQAAQQSLQNAGQQSAQNQQEPKDKQDQQSQQTQQSQQGQQEKSGSAQEKTGEGPGSSGQQTAQGSGQNGQAAGSQGGKAMGAGSGAGPGVGGSRNGRVPGQPVTPLPRVKQDQLIRGDVNRRGTHTSRSFMGTPDPTKDQAAYYQVVPERVRAAEASLNREEIPAGHREQVRRYFESISPSGK